MRHAAIYIVVFTLTSLAALSAGAEIAWESKLRDAHTKAKQQNKLMLLHFYTDNCVYCDRLEAGAFRSDSVSQSINQNFVPVKVHGGNNEKLAAMFKVTKYPTDVIVTTDGKALSHSVSPQQPDRYIAMLTGAQVTYAKSQSNVAAVTQPGQQPAAANAVAATTESTVAATTQSPTAPRSSFELPPAAATASHTMAANEMPVQIPAPGASQIAAGTDSKTTMPTMTATSRSNQFVLPGATQASTVPASTAPANALPVSTGKTGTVQATLASSRVSGGMTLPGDDALPATPAASQPSTTAANSNRSEKPELAIQGYCAVSVVNRGEWVEGKPELGVIHLGKLYLFADKAAMELFLTDPVPFTPMLNEIDVVRFFEEKKIVPGKREWGVIDPIHNRMFFFADEAAMLHFEQSFDRYLDAAIEVMDQAIEEANPGV